MWKFLFRTSWHHMSRMPYASTAVVFVLSLLILTCSIGVSMLYFLTQEKVQIERGFTYSLALNPVYSFKSKRVRDFTESLGTAGVQSPLEYITREQALDREIEKNPAILEVLSGENPLPDVIVVSLQGVNTDIFGQRIREFRDLFEGGADIESLSLQLEKFSQSLAEIRDIWHALFVFIGLTLVIMMMLLVAIFRYHLRLFIDERTVGRLVGADPIFIWGPHVVTSIIYLTLSISVSIGLFFLLQYIF